VALYFLAPPNKWYHYYCPCSRREYNNTITDGTTTCDTTINTINGDADSNACGGENGNTTTTTTTAVSSSSSGELSPQPTWVERTYQ